MSKAPAVAIPTQDSAARPSAAVERWLFVDGADSFGGHEVMLLRWLEELAAQRTVKASVLARAGTQLSRDAARYADVYTLASRGMLRVVRDAIGLVRTAIRSRPDVCIVAEGCLLSQPLFVWVAKLIGLRVLLYVPMLQTSVSMGFGNGRMRDAIVRRFYSKLPDGWVTITSEQGEDFRRWARIRQPIFVLQNTVARAVESATYADIPAVAKEATRLRVLVLGRIEAHQKGLDLLLDHARANASLGERLTLAFVGTGPFEAAIASALHSDAALAQWVTLAPWSPTLQVMRDHDVLLMTSRYEGVPLVMLEAMALGVPVVAPDFAGTRAFLPSECLFPVGDLSAAFATLARLEDPSVRMQLAQRNRAAFEAKASNGAFAAAVKALTLQIRAFSQRRSAA